MSPSLIFSVVAILATAGDFTTPPDKGLEKAKEICRPHMFQEIGAYIMPVSSQEIVSDGDYYSPGPVNYEAGWEADCAKLFPVEKIINAPV